MCWGDCISAWKMKGSENQHMIANSDILSTIEKVHKTSIASTLVHSPTLGSYMTDENDFSQPHSAPCARKAILIVCKSPELIIIFLMCHDNSDANC